MAFVTPVLEHWLERERAQWVHPMKDRSDDPSHHEWMLLPRSYISLPGMLWSPSSTYSLLQDNTNTTLWPNNRTSQNQTCAMNKPMSCQTRLQREALVTRHTWTTSHPSAPRHFKLDRCENLRPHLSQLNGCLFRMDEQMSVSRGTLRECPPAHLTHPNGREREREKCFI